MTRSGATQELPSGGATAADGGRGIPSDAAAVRSTDAIAAANLLAGQAVSVVMSYLDGNSDAARLALDLEGLSAGIFGERDPAALPLVKLVRILIAVCKGILDADAEAQVDGAALNMRDLWQDIARDVVRALRYKSWMLCGGDSPAPDLGLIDDGTRLAALLVKDAERELLRGELAQLEAANAEAAGSGDAARLRQARIEAILHHLASVEPRG